MLTAASLFFGWWDVRFLPLLLLSILGNHVMGRFVGAAQGRRRIWLLRMGVAANLLLLGVFKYTDFLIGAPAGLTGAGFTPLAIVLPIMLFLLSLFSLVPAAPDVVVGDLPAGSLSCRSR